MFDKLMSDHGLEDVFRQLEGRKARSYTRLGPTVHTRIDCIFGPRKSDHFQWYSYSTTDTLRGPTWSSDHLAIITELKRVDHHNIPKGRPRVDPAIFTLHEPLTSLLNMYREIKSQYPTSEYGHAVVMSYQLSSAAHLMSQLSADHKSQGQEVELSDLLQKKLSQNVKDQTEAGPNRALKDARKALLKGIQRWRKANKPIDPAAAHRRVAFEETSTKQFHHRFRAKQEKRYILELHPMGPNGLPDLKAQPVSNPADLVSHTTQYYSTLMSPKPSEPSNAQILANKLREKRLSKRSREKLEGKITEGEVLAAIKRMARNKACGPDGIPAEYFHAMTFVSVRSSKPA